MKATMRVLCLALLAMFVVGAENPLKKKAKGDGSSGVGVSCSAFAAIKIRVSRGRCSGEASADCKAIASSQSALREAYGVWWSDGGECESVKLEEAAKAIATAGAAVYIASLVKVHCQGKGFACGFAIGQGEAFATAFARAVAQAAVDTGGSATSAFCIADVEAVSGAIAEAAASAQSKACVKDVGSEEDFQTAFVEQVTNAIAEAFATASAATCDKEGAAAAKSKCTGEAESSVTEKGSEASTERGSTSRHSAQLDACVNPGKCCDPDFKETRCICPDCKGLPWFRKSDWDGVRLRSWRPFGRDKEVCFCYDEHHHASAVV